MPLDKTFAPAEIEPRLYEGWERAGAFACDPNSNATPVHHHDPAAERHRLPAYGSCADLHGAGHADPLPPHDGPRRAVAAGHRPRRHRHADGGGAAARRPRGSTGARWAARSSSSGSGNGRPSPAAPSRSQLRRLGASLDWPRERFTMDDGLSAAVREVFVDAVSRRPDLSRPAAGQLGPETADRDFRPRGGEPRDPGFALVSPLSDRGRARPVHHRRHHAAGDDVGRYRGRGASRASDAGAPDRQARDPAAGRAARSRSSATTMPIRRRAPAR